MVYFLALKQPRPCPPAGAALSRVSEACQKAQAAPESDRKQADLRAFTNHGWGELAPKPALGTELVLNPQPGSSPQALRARVRSTLPRPSYWLPGHEESWDSSILRQSVAWHQKASRITLPHQLTAQMYGYSCRFNMNRRNNVKAEAFPKARACEHTDNCAAGECPSQVLFVKVSIGRALAAFLQLQEWR